jgi:hypothetical protein
VKDKKAAFLYVFFHAAGQKGKDGSSTERENHRTLKHYNDCSASAPKLFTPKALYQICVGAAARIVNNLFCMFE